MNSKGCYASQFMRIKLGFSSEKVGNSSISLQIGLPLVGHHLIDKLALRIIVTNVIAPLEE